MIGCCGIVPQDSWCGVGVQNHNINVAIVVQVIETGTPAALDNPHSVSGFARNVRELALPSVSQQEIGDFQRRSIVHQFHSIKMAIGYEDVAVAVVVKVDEARSPVHMWVQGTWDLGFSGCIFEQTSTNVSVENGHFRLVVGDEKIQPTISVIIRAVDSHAAIDFAFKVTGYSAEQTYFLELPCSIVLEQEVGRAILSNEDVGVAIVIEVSRNHPHPRPLDHSDARRFANVFERAIPFISVESIRSLFIILRTRHEVLAFGQYRHVILVGEIDVAGYKEIQQPVAIHIEKTRTCAYGILSANACKLGDIGKCLVAIVTEQGIGTKIGYKQILITIIVIIRHNRPQAIAAKNKPRLFGYIFESHLAEISVEGMPERIGRFLGSLERCSIREVDV